MIDTGRRKESKNIAFRRICVAVDPAVSVSETSDETGIIVAGIDDQDRGYVLEDLSGKYTPTEWASKAVVAYHRWEADQIVAEKNQGGAMVESTICVIDPNVPITLVHAPAARSPAPNQSRRSTSKVACITWACFLNSRTNFGALSPGHEIAGWIIPLSGL